MTAPSDAAPLGVSTRPPRSLTRAFWPIAATAAVLALVPLWLGDSRLMMGLAVDALVFGAYAIGFNVIFGSTNQLFLCVGALAGVGGYASAILSEEAGLPLAVGLVLATVLAAALGGLLSWVAVRRSLGVIFTGIVTLAFSLSFQNLVLGQRELTGGETGLVVDAGGDTFLRDRVAAYYLFLAMLVVFLVVFRGLERSHVGWAFRALRDNQLAASDLARVLGRSRSATSQHLRVLREADVVQPARNGNVVRYTLAADINAEILKDIGRAFDRLEPSTAA